MTTTWGKAGSGMLRSMLAAALLFIIMVLVWSHTSWADRSPTTLSIIHGETEVTLNNRVKTMASPLPVVKGNTMIPIHLLASPMGAEVYVVGKEIHIDTYFKKVTIRPDMRGVRVNDRYVLLNAPVLKLNGTTHVPLSAIPQLWEGTYTFDTAEKLITIVIPPVPNVTPIADFTVQETVKRGEPLTFVEKSYDPDGKIVKQQWSERKQVYFEAGIYTVSHQVFDNDGEASEMATRQITVTEELMHSPYQYYMIYGEPGDKFPIHNPTLKDYPAVKTIESQGGRTLYLSNAPERVFDRGILYQDTLSGESRIFLHHRNGSSINKKLAIVVTNQEPVPHSITLGDRGIAGPSKSALQFGYAAAARFFEGSEKREFSIAPGESALLLPELNDIVMSMDAGISGMINVDTSGPLLFTTIMVNESDDPLNNVFNLPFLQRAGNRGTFKDADRTMEITEPLGIMETQLRLGNRGHTIPGIDALGGITTANGGEYGSVTEIRLTNVAYGTRIVLNPRAGNFFGALIVNGQVVSIPKGGYANANDAVLVYRQEQPTDGNTNTPPPEVNITYTSPGASSLPIILVFIPFTSF